jgi:hypothetical protein
MHLQIIADRQPLAEKRGNRIAEQEKRRRAAGTMQQFATK